MSESYLSIDQDVSPAPSRARRRSSPSSSLVAALEEERARNRAALGLSGLGAASVLASAVERVTIRTQATPELTWRPGAAPAEQGGGGVGAWLLGIIKPDVEVRTAFGTVRVAPYGQATRTYWPIVAAGTVVVGGGAVYLIARGLSALVRDLRRPRRIAARRR